MNSKYLKKFTSAANQVRNIISDIPDIAIIAGSGIAASFEKNKNTQTLNYNILENFPKTSVEGHHGEMLHYDFDGKNALVFSGRFHYYEGRTLSEICSIVALIHILGIKRLIITNAAGGLNPKFQVGDIMLFNDTIDFFFFKNYDSSFVPADTDYRCPVNRNNSSYQEQLEAELIRSGIPYQNGVYIGVTGPNYETRAEIRAFRRLGADAVGMSSVPELKAAKILGIETIGLSLITNTASEIMQEVTHDEVIIAARDSATKIKSIIKKAVNL
ncbi:MAG: purine-nucleoside phosphorylase [Candidatus Kapabacteria bacterium]|nr:purine-nucleoside phosphorylase [Ignavibacteriota bacterium]MCW5883443.1 purine-nucleoside phosphorylase [Candidatus Kapabacteria bacterium]